MFLTCNTIRNINLSPAISLDYNILNNMATNLPHCRAILPNFSKGPSSVTYTAIFDNNFDTSQLSPSAVTTNICGIALIAAFSKYSPIPTNSPPTSHVASYKQAASSQPSNQSSPSSALQRLKNFQASGPTKRKFYVVINGKGGSANMGIYHNSWDDVRKLVERVSHSVYRGFTNYDDALTYLQTYYPSILNETDMAHWRNNTPTNETNITNRSSIVQRDIFSYNQQPHHHLRNAHPHAPPDAANHSQRMLATISPPNRKRPSPTEATLHSKSSNSSAAPPPIIHTGQPTNDRLPTDDNMSIISNQTGLLSLSPTKKKGKTTSPSPNPSLTTIRATLPIDTTTSEALQHLRELLLNTDFAALDPESVSTAATLTSKATKSVFYTFHSASTAVEIYSILLMHPLAQPNAFVLVPPQEASFVHPTNALSDPSPHDQATVPHRCPYKNCEYALFPHCFANASEYTTHITTFHHSSFIKLPEREQLRYSLAMCPGCQVLLPPTDLPTHINECTQYVPPPPTRSLFHNYLHHQSTTRCNHGNCDCRRHRILPIHLPTLPQS